MVWNILYECNDLGQIVGVQACFSLDFDAVEALLDKKRNSNMLIFNLRFEILRVLLLEIQLIYF